MEKIFIAIDFSEASINASEYACHLANYFGAKLHFFHAYHATITNFETTSIPLITDVSANAHNSIEKKVNALRNKFKGIEMDFSLEMGLAADLIQDAAIESKADLIVLGISGQNSSLKEHLIGSVATQIAQDSPIPSLIIPETKTYSKIKNIAFACDFDKNLEANSTLTKVKYFAALFDAELQILNVMEPGEEISVEKAKTDLVLEEKLEHTKHQTFFIYERNIDDGLLEYISQNTCDIIITSPKAHNMFYKLFHESHTKRLAFHSPIPVLAIHE